MNPQRGDIAVTILGRSFTLRPSFEAIAEIEGRTGLGLLPLFRKFQMQDYGGRDVVNVVVPAVTAAMGADVASELPALIVRHGFVKLQPAIGEFLTRAMGGEDLGKTDAPAAGPAQT